MYSYVNACNYMCMYMYMYYDYYYNITIFHPMLGNEGDPDGDASVQGGSDGSGSGSSESNGGAVAGSSDGGNKAGRSSKKRGIIDERVSFLFSESLLLFLHGLATLRIAKASS